jgi:hypothetical protein
MLVFRSAPTQSADRHPFRHLQVVGHGRAVTSAAASIGDARGGSMSGATLARYSSSSQEARRERGAVNITR